MELVNEKFDQQLSDPNSKEYQDLEEKLKLQVCLISFHFLYYSHIRVFARITHAKLLLCKV